MNCGSQQIKDMLAHSHFTFLQRLLHLFRGCVIIKNPAGDRFAPWADVNDDKNDPGIKPTDE